MCREFQKDFLADAEAVQHYLDRVFEDFQQDGDKAYSSPQYGSSVRNQSKNSLKGFTPFFPGVGVPGVGVIALCASFVRIFLDNPSAP